MANFFTNSVNKIFKEKSLTEKYECLNEAKSFIDGFKKNPLSEIKRTKENVLYLSEGIDWDVPNEEKGGIIVFSTDVNAVELDKNKFLNFFSGTIFFHSLKV